MLTLADLEAFMRINQALLAREAGLPHPDSAPTDLDADAPLPSSTMWPWFMALMAKSHQTQAENRPHGFAALLRQPSDHTDATDQAEPKTDAGSG